MKILDTLKFYKEELEKDGYKVLYIGLYGSQNYGIDDEASDIDAKVIVLPTIDDIVFRKTVSFVRDFGELGACDVKDLITYYQVVKKGNFSFLEPFWTNYFLGEVYLRVIFKQIPVNKMSILGGMLEKRRALTHEYPSKTKEFELYGCDPKQYHHVVRLYDMAMSEKTYPYLVYKGERADYMKAIKRGLNGKTLDELIEDSDKKIAEVKELYSGLERYQELDLEQEVGFYLRQKLREELLYEKR